MPRRARSRVLACAVLAMIAGIFLLLRPGSSSAPLPDDAAAAPGPRASRSGSARSFRLRSGRGDALVLTGVVVTSEGLPVAAARVEVPGKAPIETDAQGRFSVEDLEPGPLVMQARHEDAVSDPVRVHLGTGATRVVLRLHAGARLSLRVISATTEEPIALADVQVRSGAHGETLMRTERTDADGRVELRGLSSQSYVVMATAHGFQGVEEPLPPRAGLRWSHELRLEPGASVAGRVVDASGRPVGDALVGAHRAERAAGLVHLGYQGAFDVRTNERGEFTLPALGAGDFQLRASHPSHVPGWSALVSTDGATPRTGVVIQLESGAVVEGVVVTSQGVPAPYAVVRAGTVDVAVAGGGARATTADGSGRFRLEGLPETAVDVVASTDAASSQPVRVELDARAVRSIELRLSYELAIRGVVTDPREQPIAGATVVCVGPPDGAIGTRPIVPETTDSTGAFACRGLAAATYELTARKPGNNNNTGPWQRSAGAVAQAGDDAVVIMIPDDGGLRARVRTARGTVPASFGVELDEGGLPRMFESTDGVFDLDGLAPREYELVITAPGERATVAVTIPEGDVLDLGTITLRVEEPRPPARFGARYPDAR